MGRDAGAAGIRLDILRLDQLMAIMASLPASKASQPKASGRIQRFRHIVRGEAVVEHSLAAAVQ